MDKPANTGPVSLSANTIKLIAAIAMVIDHTAVIFVPSFHPLHAVMRMIGRITGPVFFFFVAEGYRRTSNVNRYTLRLLAFAAISYLPYIFALISPHPRGADFFSLNVIYTLLIGLCGIRVRHEVKNPLLRWTLLGLLFLCSIPGDWGYIGFLIMLIFDVFHGRFRQGAFCYSLFFMAQFGIFGALASPVEALLGSGRGMNTGHLVQLGMLLPLLLLSFYRGEKGGGGCVAKWGFYIFYPLHLLLLGGIHVLL